MIGDIHSDDQDDDSLDEISAFPDDDAPEGNGAVNAPRNPSHLAPRPVSLPAKPVAEMPSAERNDEFGDFDDEDFDDEFDDDFEEELENEYGIEDDDEVKEEDLVEDDDVSIPGFVVDDDEEETAEPAEDADGDAPEVLEDE